MGRFKDYTGTIHGCWKVIKRDYHPTSKSHETFWKCECLNCGTIKSIRKTDLDRNPRSCKNCEGRFHKGAYQIGDKFGKLTIIGKGQNHYKPSGNIAVYALCQCECGNIVNVSIKNLRSGKTISCGCAKESSGEIKLTQLLDELKIDYKKQYRIREFNYFSPFDVAIFKNKKLFYLIEYDGEQHFVPVEYFGGEEKFLLQRQRDQNKDKWCLENNIPLLRIPYTDYKILTKEYLFEKIPNLL